METKPKTKIKGLKIRKMNENTIHKFSENFNKEPIIQVTTLEEAVNYLNQEMPRTLNLVTPTKEVKAKERKPTPWYNEELKQQRKILKNRECNGSKTGKITTGLCTSMKEIDKSTCSNS